MHIYMTRDDLRRTVLQPATTHFKIKLVDIEQTANIHAQVWAETRARKHAFSFKKKNFPGRIAETPRADTSDSACRSRRHRVSTIFFFLVLIAFITGNSSLEPLIEGLCAQIHMNLR